MVLPVANPTPPNPYQYLPVNANVPVIPEIAQAYQNDPRTKIAQAAITSGTDTGAVARGQYGLADGIARALRGVIGGYIQKQQQGKYTGFQNTTLNNAANYASQQLTADPATGAPVTNLNGPLTTTGGGATNPDGTMALPDTTSTPNSSTQLPPPPPNAPPPPPGPVPSTPPPPGPTPPDGTMPLGGVQPPPPSPDPNAASAGGPLTGQIASMLQNPPPGPQGAVAPLGAPGNSLSGVMGPNAAPIPPPGGTPPPGPATLNPSVVGGATGNTPFGQDAGAGLPAPSPSAPLAAGPPSTPSPASPASPSTPPAPTVVNGVPQQALVAIPDAPALVSKPDMPTVAPPARSRLLDAAYQMMLQKNPFLFDKSLEMQAQGLSDQDKINQAVVERQADLQKAGYVSGLEAANTSQAQASQAVWQTRAAAQKQNYDIGNTAQQQQFQDIERTRTEGFEAGQNALNRAATIEAARVRMEQGDISSNAPLLQSLALQGLQGDQSVFQNLGRGPTGARNAAALHSTMYALAAKMGLSPAALANINAQYKGLGAEAVTAGRRVGATDVATSEVGQLADPAKVSHAALSLQGPIVPWNKAVQMYQSNTSSPELAKAVVDNQALVNAYARSFGSGQLSVSNKQDAQNKLAMAWGTPAYGAAVDEIVSTIGRERAGAKGALANIGTGGTAPPVGGTAAPRPAETDTQRLARYGIRN